MASKYDDYWLSREDEIRAAIMSAISGESAALDVGDIARLGKRGSWSGTATVRGAQVVESSMAHVTSLARLVAAKGMCSVWATTTFRLAVSSGLTLRISTEASSPHPAPPTASPVVRPIVSRDPGATISSRTRAAPHACERIHEALDPLPLYRSPSEVPFGNGLYFFYEDGETSPHAQAGRVVRIGNHPRSHDRLVGRLREHYRTRVNAKNGSVFRRYLGGALIRQAQPDSPCLDPAPGKGHWEVHGGAECPLCEPTEALVTARLDCAFSFRCVQIDDMAERNELESSLIATLAGCSTCAASGQWLGRHAYSTGVHVSGLWNSEFINAKPLAVDGVARFEALTGASQPRAKRQSLDLSTTLLVIPCSGAKQGGPRPDLVPVSVRSLLGPGAQASLDTGRTLAFQRRATKFDPTSQPQIALAMYSGQPYSTPGVRKLLVDAIGRGLHCLIISGGYGLLRAEEPIQNYSAHLGTQTKNVWARRLPTILIDYVQRAGIQRSVVVLSQHYADCVPVLTTHETRFVPIFHRGVDEGAALQVVPAQIGAELHGILTNLIATVES